MANDSSLETVYNNVTAQVAAQNDMVHKLVSSQQDLQKRVASSYSDDRHALEQRLQQMERRLAAVEDNHRVLRQQQDHVVRLVALQDKVRPVRERER